MGTKTNIIFYPLGIKLPQRLINMLVKIKDLPFLPHECGYNLTHLRIFSLNKIPKPQVLKLTKKVDTLFSSISDKSIFNHASFKTILWHILIGEFVSSMELSQKILQHLYRDTHKIILNANREITVLKNSVNTFEALAAYLHTYANHCKLALQRHAKKLTYSLYRRAKKLLNIAKDS